MSVPTEKFNINLNQNLWGLVVAFVSLGLSEYYHLCVLFWFALVLSMVMALSVTVTTVAYTVKYCKGKLA